MISEVYKDRAVIASSYMLFLLGHLDPTDLRKGSVIKLRTFIFAKISKEGKELASLADKAWNQVADTMNKTYVYSIGVAVESLFFNFEKELVAYFGNNISLNTLRAVMKLPNDERGVKPSYELVDALKASVDKIVFDYKKENAQL